MQYNLVATVNHKVGARNNGHYMTVGKSQTSNCWFHYDDDKVCPKKITYKKSNFAKAPSQKSATILFYVDDRSISFHSNNLRTDNGNIDNMEGAIGDSNQLCKTTPNTVNLQENNLSLSSDSVKVLPVRLACDGDDRHPACRTHQLLPEEGQELWMVGDNKNLDAMDVPMVQRRKNTKPNDRTPTHAQKTDVGQSLYYREAMEGDEFKGNEEEEEEECDNGKQRRRKTKRQANTQNTDSDNRNVDAMDVLMVQRRKNTKPNAHTPTRAQKTLSSKNTLTLKRCNRHHYIWIQTHSNLTYKMMVEQRQQNYLHQEIMIQEKSTLQVQTMKKVYFCPL